MRLSAIAAPLLLSAALFAGCEGSVSIGEKTLSKDELEKQSVAALTKQAGQQAPPVTCPEDGVKAEVDAKVICTMELDGKPYDVTVTITAIDGDDAKFAVKVADKPRS